jgi:hypothetical protein
MQFNLPLHNNLEARRRKKINQINTNNNGQPKNQSQTPATEKKPQPTLETVHITMKWPKFSREIHNLLCLLILFHSINPWLLKHPLLGVVLAIFMMRPLQVNIFICLMGLI